MESLSLRTIRTIRAAPVLTSPNQGRGRRGAHLTSIPLEQPLPPDPGARAFLPAAGFTRTTAPAMGSDIRRSQACCGQESPRSSGTIQPDSGGSIRTNAFSSALLPGGTPQRKRPGTARPPGKRPMSSRSPIIHHCQELTDECGRTWTSQRSRRWYVGLAHWRHRPMSLAMRLPTAMSPQTTRRQHCLSRG